MRGVEGGCGCVVKCVQTRRKCSVSVAIYKSSCARWAGVMIGCDQFANRVKQAIIIYNICVNGVLAINCFRIILLVYFISIIRV